MAEVHALAIGHARRFRAARARWAALGGDVAGAFGAVAAAGSLELFTATATHAFFPALDDDRAVMRLQVGLAVEAHARRFGRPPRGLWLGECGYVPGVDALLAEAGVRWFVVDGHALELADARPVYGTWAPVYCPSGVAAFGRDPASAEQVWSVEAGYPGDPCYRDYWRDVGFELPAERVRTWVHPGGHRVATGIKYHAITHRTLEGKALYDPAAAARRVAEHARHFCRERMRAVAAHASAMDRPPLVVAPYDAELFGHWWYEGPRFLDAVFREMATAGGGLEPLTPSEYLSRHPTNQVATPAASSWGEAGFSAYWIDETNAWVYRHLHAAAERLERLAGRHRTVSGVARRALTQAVRELLLAQASDWAFILRSGTTVAYATRRVTEHLATARALCDGVEADAVDPAAVAAAEARTPIFPELDYGRLAG